VLIKYMVLDHALLHFYPTTDSSTRMGMIGVTINMSNAAEECRKLSGNFTLSGEWSPCILSVYILEYYIVSHYVLLNKFYLCKPHCSYCWCT